MFTAADAPFITLQTVTSSFKNRSTSNHESMRRLLYILVCCVAIAGCKSTSKTQTTPETNGKTSATEAAAPKKSAKAEDFDKFYDRFHTDSAFQLSRVKFPLKGGEVGLEKTTPYTRQNWQMMRTRIYDIDKSQYKVEYNKTETTFTQRVWVEGSGFSTECRFELIGSQWFLVYVKDENL